MGMAVMLDEIINYVQSLQNQVEVNIYFAFFYHKKYINQIFLIQLFY